MVRDRVSTGHRLEAADPAEVEGAGAVVVAVEEVDPHSPAGTTCVDSVDWKIAASSSIRATMDLKCLKLHSI